MENKLCSYRNCINLIIGRRSDSKYCCSKCKENEKTYLKRDKKKLESEKDNIKKMLIDYHNIQMDKELLSLYSKIYK